MKNKKMKKPKPRRCYICKNNPEYRPCFLCYPEKVFAQMEKRLGHELGSTVSFELVENETK